MSSTDEMLQLKIIWAKLSQIYAGQRFDDVLEKFESIGDNAAKIKYALSLLKNNDLFPKVPLRYPKNDAQSSNFRKIGNNCFLKERYFDALELYNKSICFAESGTENLSIGYANRSAVYIKWQMFDSCLENIRLAKEANYPVHLMLKLEQREVECQELKNAKRGNMKEKAVPKLSYPAHAQVPFMADSIEFEENEKFGRHLIAKRDLKVGDIVMLEKPFEVRIREQNTYRRCTNCLAENELSLIPCPDCTSAMFCSAQCLSTAQKKFHKYECPIIETFPLLQAGSIVMAMRILLTLIDEYDGVENLFAVVEELRENGSPASLLKYCSEVGRQEMHNFFHLLTNNIEKKQNVEIYQTTLMLAVVYNFFKENTEFKVLLENENDENKFLDLLFQYTLTCRNKTTVMDVFERGNLEDGEVLEAAQFGTGIYLVSSLINHSCLPNVVRIFCQTTHEALTVLSPIKKGSQLFDNYGFPHTHVSKYDRQYQLQKKYKFTCDCVACSNDYPMFHMMPIRTPISNIITPFDDDRYKLLDSKTVVNNLKKYKSYVEENYHYYPCQRVSAVQNMMERSFRTCFGNISLNTK